MEKDYLSKMQNYFTEAGVLPGKEFRCNVKQFCEGIENNTYANGMQCHIGENYGRYPRLLIISLDCGNGGAQTIHDRVNSVMNTCSGVAPGDIHMLGKIVKGNRIPGTHQCARILLDMPDEQLIAKHYCMTNACKCCNISNANTIRAKYYQNCAVHKIKELEILDPDIILVQSTQGKAYYGLENNIHTIDGIPEKISKYLFRYSNNGKDCYLIKSLHPSARGRHTGALINYYANIFPEIVQYIKRHPLNQL